MTKPFRIRQARMEDAEPLTSLVRDLAIWHDDDPSPVTTKSVRDNMVASSHVHVLVAETDGLIGYCAASPTYEAAYASNGLYISDLFVAEPMRGTGCGKALLAAMAAHAKRIGFGHVWLTALNSNEQAHSWYRAMTDIHAQVTAYALTEEKFDDLSRIGETHLTGEK